MSLATAPDDPRQQIVESPATPPNPASLRNIIAQFSRFTLVGVAGTAVHYGVMAVMIEALGISPLPSSATGFIVSAAVSYWLNYRITFASAMSHARALPKFLIVGTAGLGINSLLVGILTGPAGWHWLAAQACASAIVLCWNFAINRVWTFS